MACARAAAVLNHPWRCPDKAIQPLATTEASQYQVAHGIYVIWLRCRASGCTCGAAKATSSAISFCRPLKKSCLCDGNTCTNTHVNDCASHHNCMMECSACITRHIRSSSGSLTVQTPARICDPSWSSSQTSPRAARARRT